MSNFLDNLFSRASKLNKNGGDFDKKENLQSRFNRRQKRYCV